MGLRLEPAAGEEGGWRRISLRAIHEDGGEVAMQLLRPASWVAESELRAGRLVALPESELGAACVAAVDFCGLRIDGGMTRDGFGRW